MDDEVKDEWKQREIISDKDMLAWLETREGRDWLETASLGELCVRQSYIRDRADDEANNEYDIIEAAIRGEPPIIRFCCREVRHVIRKWAAKAEPELKERIYCELRDLLRLEFEGRSIVICRDDGS